MAVANNKSVSKRSKWFLLIGFFFFFNPIITVLDVFPDLFGTILLFFGLVQLAFFNESVAAARKHLLFLMAVNFIKMLLTSSVMSSELLSNKLLAATAFSVVEGLIYALFIHNLFDGVSYYASRHNCKQALEKSNGVAFLSYLFFFIRIAATVIPELPGLLETQSLIETDPEKLEAINDILTIKPMLTIIFSLIALGFGIAWLISILGFVKTFYNEAGEELEISYCEEYTSQPAKMRPKKIRTACFTAYFALAFSIDFAIDGIRILPIAAMFAVLYIAALLFKKTSRFKQTEKNAPIAALLFVAAEVFRAVFVPNGAVIIYETDLWIVIVSALIALVTVPFSMFALRGFFADIYTLADKLGVNRPKPQFAWISYCAMITLWTSSYVIPYFHSFISTPKLIAAGIFIWQTVKTLGSVREADIKKADLYGI